jgi:hypothetical protein
MQPPSNQATYDSVDVAGRNDPEVVSALVSNEENHLMQPNKLAWCPPDTV